MLVQLTPDFQNACHHLAKDVWCDLGEAQRSTMGGKESKQFPISYDEASKRGEIWRDNLMHISHITYLLQDINANVLISKHYKSEFSVTDHEKRRLQDAFRRSSAANNNISKQVHTEAHRVACKSQNHFWTPILVPFGCIFSFCCIFVRCILVGCIFVCCNLVGCIFVCSIFVWRIFAFCIFFLHLGLLALLSLYLHLFHLRCCIFVVESLFVASSFLSN